jgi:hypothetical protein
MRQIALAKPFVPPEPPKPEPVCIIQPEIKKVIPTFQEVKHRLFPNQHTPMGSKEREAVLKELKSLGWIDPIRDLVEKKPQNTSLPNPTNYMSPINKVIQPVIIESKIISKEEWLKIGNNHYLFTEHLKKNKVAS